MLKHLPATALGIDAESHLIDMTDGSFEVVAVEVFDAPTSYREVLGTDVGPWVLGPEEEVRAFLDAQGYEDFEVQYRAP